MPSALAFAAMSRAGSTPTTNMPCSRRARSMVPSLEPISSQLSLRGPNRSLNRRVVDEVTNEYGGCSGYINVVFEKHARVDDIETWWQVRRRKHPAGTSSGACRSVPAARRRSPEAWASAIGRAQGRCCRKGGSPYGGGPRTVGRSYLDQFDPNDIGFVDILCAGISTPGQEGRILSEHHRVIDHRCVEHLVDPIFPPFRACPSSRGDDGNSRSGPQHVAVMPVSLVSGSLGRYPSLM